MAGVSGKQSAHPKRKVVRIRHISDGISVTVTVEECVVGVTKTLQN